MASEYFKKLFLETADKVATGQLKDNVGDHVIIKHYFETLDHPYSASIPIVKNAHNEELFLNKLEELHSLRMDFYQEVHDSPNWEKEDLEQFILAHTFFRATIEDFENPIEYLNREIAFLNHHLPKAISNKGSFFYIGDFSFGKIKDTKINLSLEKNLVGYESNHCLKIKFVNSDFKSFELPDVHFDIDDKIVFIKGIQKSELDGFNKNDSWAKNLNRVTYKANQGSENEKEKVPPTHLISLVIAISFFQNLGYQKFAFPTHHPARTLYYSGFHLNIVNKMYKPLIKKDLLTVKQLKALLKKKMEYINNINHNITDRFLNTVLRYVSHFPETEILDYGDDLGYLVLDTSKQKEYDDNHILHCIHNGMYKNLQKKLS